MARRSVSTAASALVAASLFFATTTGTITGVLTKTQAGDSLSATGAVAIQGALSKTQGGDSLSSTGAVAIRGTLAKTQAGDTLSSTGVVFDTFAGTQLWASADRPALGSMSVTTKFCDGVPGDTSTGETGSDSLSFSGGCAVRQVTGALTGVLDFGTIYNLTAFRYTISARSVSYAASTCLYPPGDPGAVTTYSEEAEYSVDGSSWTGFTFSGIGAATGTASVTGLNVNLRYLRLIAKASFRDIQDVGTISGSATVSDIRATATLGPITGVLTKTQAGDTLSSTATIANAPILGVLAKTQAGDTLAATATIADNCLCEWEDASEPCAVAWSGDSTSTGAWTGDTAASGTWAGDSAVTTVFTQETTPSTEWTKERCG